MPCHDYGYDEWIENETKKNPENYTAIKIESVNNELNELTNYLKDKLDQTTRLLCFVCKQIELGDKANFDCDEAKELWMWWETHKEQDRKREDK